ncbi:hypothetical protein Pfo_010455 [Paulownia fortunei]|nr:hypothetical protein Pfo_010455 [Paulownia fortunei]
MSSSDSEILIPPITQSLPISELIKLIKHSFRERDFNEVQNILIDREKSMKAEMENLIRDCDSIKEEVLLLERTQGLAELEKLKFEEKLQRSERKCEELKETIARLVEEKRVCSDRIKRSEKRYDKVSTENSKMANEKNKLIFELNEKINELKNKNLESERLVGVYQEKFKCLDTRLVKMGQEIEDLRCEKLAANQTAEELRRKQLEADQVVEELKHQNFEAAQTVDELRLKKLESDKAAELNKSRLENLAPRIMKVEEALANILNVKVEDLANIVDGMDKPAAAEGENVDFLDFKGEKDSSGNGSTRDGWNGDAENMVVMSPGVPSTSNSTGSGCIGLSKKGPHASGMHSDGGVPVRGRLMFGAGCSTKMACSSSAAGDIIQISDSDDETNPGGAAYISDMGVSANVGANEMIFEKFVQSPSSSKTNKRNSTDCREDSLTNLTSKRKRSIFGSDEDNLPSDEMENQVIKSTHDRIVSLHNDFTVKRIPDTGLPQAILPSISCSLSRRCEEKAGAACGSQTPLQKFNGLNDGDSTDSEDESCTDSCMDDLVATLRSKKLSKKWMFEADMLQAFQEDEELCLNAVCALYRQQIFAKKSTQGSNLPKSGGFSHVDSMSGRALAEYLIDGDRELRLRKSVSEVKQQRPDVLRQCKRLASIYHEKLYEIYSKAEDPFFGQK